MVPKTKLGYLGLNPGISFPISKLENNNDTHLFIC